MKQYKTWQPDAVYLLPPSPADWLQEGHLAYFVKDVVLGLDFSAIEADINSRDDRGEKPFPPALMFSLLVYGYCTGISASRRIERAVHEDIAFMVIAGSSRPNFRTISEFRRRYLHEVKGLFLQVLCLCQAAGLVKLGHVALDGTKFRANASKHKAMSYGRMLKTESALKEEVASLLGQAKEADASDDARLGVGKPEHEIPDELKRRKVRLKRLQEAKAALEAEAHKTRMGELAAKAEAAAAAAATAMNEAKRGTLLADKAAHEDAAANLAARREAANRDSNDEPPPATGGGPTADGLVTHKTAATAEGIPAPGAQRNFTDPDSRLMKTPTGYEQAYNCQQAVDEAHQIIVAEAVSNQGNDSQFLEPMLKQVGANCGATPTAMTADAGYWNRQVDEQAARRGTTAYVAVGRERKDAVASSKNKPRQAMKARLTTDEGKEIYRRRKFVVEPVHGQIKQARGLRQFLLRGLAKVAGEWSLICLGHNLLKLFRYGPGMPALRTAMVATA